jgi:hypothetical protein
LLQGLRSDALTGIDLPTKKTASATVRPRNIPPVAGREQQLRCVGQHMNTPMLSYRVLLHDDARHEVISQKENTLYPALFALSSAKESNRSER